LIVDPRPPLRSVGSLETGSGLTRIFLKIVADPCPGALDLLAGVSFSLVIAGPHPELSLAEKRAILASWASDAAAIHSCPALRAPEGLKGPVSIDEILEALQALDGGPRHPPGGKPKRLRSVSRLAA
jgi:hypothetical protein